MTEAQRLAILSTYDILDTPKEVAFDKITKMACEIFKVPISTISFVDMNRIWYKSAYGVSILEMPFEQSLCGIPASNNELFIIEDAQNDPRKEHYSMLKDNFGLRFYASFPICVAPGCNIGVLNIFDKEPRIFTTHDTNILENLANLVVNILELRLTAREALQSEIRMGNTLKAIYESTTEASTFVDVDYKLVFVNKMAEVICQHVFGAVPKIGDNFLNWMRPHLRDEFKSIFEQALAGKTITKQQKDGNYWYQFDYFPVYDPNNIVVGVSQSVKNITESKNNEIKIIEQNEKLKAIAWSQSHELRQPVAQILGLVQLMKSEKIDMNDIHKIHINFLYQATENLDNIIRKIVNQTDSV